MSKEEIQELVLKAGERALKVTADFDFYDQGMYLRQHKAGTTVGVSEECFHYAVRHGKGKDPNRVARAVDVGPDADAAHAVAEAAAETGEAGGGEKDAGGPPENKDAARARKKK